MPLRPVSLLRANDAQLRADPPNVAVLPWGATEAHGRHLPYGTDVIEATAFAEGAAERAQGRGAKVVVLPTVPFGNNAQQLDQIATIHLSTASALALLSDVAHSLAKQGIDRLVVLNAHGGNEFKPLVRDVQERSGTLIVVANFYQAAPDAFEEIFARGDDHAGEMETSLLLHLCPENVDLGAAGDGARVPFAIQGLSQPGVWTPRPWSASHPDLGAGDPSRASAAKGERYFERVCDALADLLTGLSAAQKGDLPYL